VREFLRGQLDGSVDYKVGALTGSRFHVIGEDAARAQSRSPAPIDRLTQPTLSEATPWASGVLPGRRLARRSRMESLRRDPPAARCDLRRDPAGGPLRGGELATEQVRTFQRVLGFLPVGDTVPPATVSAFSPRSVAAYAEMQARVADVAVTAGLRYDQFDARTASVGKARGARRSLSPRFAVSTVLKGATVVASYGRFSQAPDYQFLVDAAFDDTTRTGRFRRGNPDLGFEQATQYEFSVRVRAVEAVSIRVGVLPEAADRARGIGAARRQSRLHDLRNADAGTSRGVEILAERELRNGYGFRVAYTLSDAKATSTDPFLLNRLLVVDPVTGDTNRPARAEFPLDFDQRHTLTVIARGKAPESLGPKLLGVRPWPGSRER